MKCKNANQGILQESIIIYYDFVPFNESDLPKFNYYLEKEDVLFYKKILNKNLKLVSTYPFQVNPVITFVNWNSLINSKSQEDRNLFLFEINGFFLVIM